MFPFPRESRITRGAEIQRIAKEGKRIRTTHIEVRAASPLVHLQTQSGGMRVGLIVPRYKNSAVARNRLKRRLKEIARLRMLPSGLPVDVVLRTRPEAYSASFEALSADISRAMSQLAPRAKSDTE